MIPLVSIACGAAISVGVLRLRREWVRAGRFSSAADLVTIPLFVGALCFFAGWASLPFVIVAFGGGLGFLLSGRFSFSPNHSKRKRSIFLSGAFGLSSMLAWKFAAGGTLSPAAISGSLVLATYLVYLFIKSDDLWQHLGLRSWR
jgi:hypothetical protein